MIDAMPRNRGLLLIHAIFGRGFRVMLLVLVLICATVGVAVLLGGFGDDGLMARLLPWRLAGPAIGSAVAAQNIAK
jgi:hypothetical protein